MPNTPSNEPSLEQKYQYNLTKVLDVNIHDTFLEWSTLLQLHEVRDIASIQQLYKIYKEIDEKTLDMYFSYISPEPFQPRSKITASELKEVFGASIEEHNDDREKQKELQASYYETIERMGISNDAVEKKMPYDESYQKIRTIVSEDIFSYTYSDIKLEVDPSAFEQDMALALFEVDTGSAKISLLEAYEHDDIAVKCNALIESQKKYILSNIRNLLNKLESQLRIYADQDKMKQFKQQVATVLATSGQTNYIRKLISYTKRTPEGKKAFLSIIDEIPKESATFIINDLSKEVFGDKAKDNYSY